MPEYNRYQNKKKYNLLIFCLVINSFYICAQEHQSIRIFDSIQYINKLDSLNIKFGLNKIIPTDLQISSLLALLHYPDLTATKIVFKNSKIRTTLNARPAFFSLFHRNKAKRKYVIRINNSKKPGKVSIYDVGFNCKIGLLGHEFAHILDYQNKNFFGVLKRAFSYLSEKSKKKFEFEIDKMTIQNGLGWQLYDWSYFVLNQSDASEEYKEFKQKIYMTPDYILSTMSENGYSLN